jgi:hypothetical protein
MVDLSLTCFAIPREMDVSFGTITTAIVSAGENDRDPYQDGQDVRVFDESGYTCPMTRKKHFQSKDMIRDFACSPTIRFILRALTRPLEVHHPKTVSLPQFLKRQATTKAFEWVLACPLVQSYFARHVPRHHTKDVYLRFWYSLPHWAFLEFYLSWHVIDSTFTAALPREANVH